MAFQQVTDLYVLTMFFKSQAQGWSERHFLAGGTTSLLPTAQTLVDYRLALLPATCSLVYSRYSNMGGKRDSIPLKYPYPALGNYLGEPIPPGTPAPGTTQIEVSQIAVELRVWNDVGDAATRWVHGVPDARVTGETMTTALTIATVAPPAVGDAGFSADWAVRFGYYMYQIKQLTQMGRKVVGLGALLGQWQASPIADMIPRGVSVKKTGAPFGQRRGHVPVGA